MKYFLLSQPPHVNKKESILRSMEHDALLTTVKDIIIETFFFTQLFHRTHFETSALNNPILQRTLQDYLHSSYV